MEERLCSPLELSYKWSYRSHMVSIVFGLSVNCYYIMKKTSFAFFTDHYDRVKLAVKFNFKSFQLSWLMIIIQIEDG